MNGRNLACWAIALAVYAVLVVVGSSQPIEMQRGSLAPWARFWREVERVPLAAPHPKDLPPPRPPPAPPPQPLSRTEAEQLIGISACREPASKLTARLRRSIRMSPVPIDDISELAPGASRLAAQADLPPRFAWPQADGRPLQLVAQVRLSDLASLDDEHLLPASGWLCFFYAPQEDPHAAGLDDDEQPSGEDLGPAERGTWHIVHFDVDASLLVRTAPPGPLPDTGGPCAVRFWAEWTLPALVDVPRLLDQYDNCRSSYDDLRLALSGRPQELGWHHLLGHAQSSGEPLRLLCELEARGMAWSDVDEADAKSMSALRDAADIWILLLEVDLDALARVYLPGDQPRFRLRATERGVWFWIREADLRERDFTRACVIGE